ncbi:bacitracin resistance protein [Microbacterium sp. CFH 31415]|uniref:bacitracin resistance protein n=1 Tax=Microbacterium sp. CFH 31415 TaxID=2921732 RepID=UPI001F137244|nr:bacitracin resistance protein [Microbacterium sp. CFH 31415]MCH6229244.1 bacitracin resistance protein [Microbacterium sp. CFH 31415]
MSDSIADAAASGSPAAMRTPVWVVVAISVVFGLFYAYALWNALAFLIAQASGPLGLNGYGWFVLLLAVVFPLGVFGAAFALAWRRPAWQFALVLFTGLCVVAVFWLNVIAYAAVYGASLLG